MNYHKCFDVMMMCWIRMKRMKTLFSSWIKIVQTLFSRFLISLVFIVMISLTKEINPFQKKKKIVVVSNCFIQSCVFWVSLFVFNPSYCDVILHCISQCFPSWITKSSCNKNVYSLKRQQNYDRKKQDLIMLALN